MNLQTRSTQTAWPLGNKRANKVPTRTLDIRYLQPLNLITVKGWSINSDIQEKYVPLLMEIESHLKNNDTLKIYFKYHLFNCTTAKYLFTIIKMLNKAQTNGKTVKIYWSCSTENEDEMLETGIDLSEMCDFNFEITYC